MAKAWKPVPGRVDVAGQGLWIKGHLQCVVNARHLSILHDLRMATDREITDCLQAFWPLSPRSLLVRFNVHNRMLNKRGQPAGPRYLIIIRHDLYDSPAHMEVQLVDLGVNRDQIKSGMLVVAR